VHSVADGSKFGEFDNHLSSVWWIQSIYYHYTCVTYVQLNNFSTTVFYCGHIVCDPWIQQAAVAALTMSAIHISFYATIIRYMDSEGWRHMPSPLSLMP